MVQGLEVDRPVNRSGDMEEAGAHRDDQLALGVADADLLLPRIVAAREEVRRFSTLNCRLSTRGFAAFGCDGAALRYA